MMRRNWIIFFEDILTSIDKIERYVTDLDFDEFAGNEVLIDAVVRNLEIIGEASRNIPEEVQERYPEVPWKRMIGLRNIVIHKYFEVDLNIVWEIITKNLPDTKPAILAAVQDQRSSETQ
jgi:uncharacterized protein with HEPN domain